MTHETYTPSLETLSKIDFASLELFKDADRFQKFAAFEQNYSGKYAPQLIRERGAGEITYDTQVLSAITERCSHLIDVRRAHEVRGMALDDRLRYLVTTLDFATGDTTEWHLYKHGNDSFDGLRLLLSYHPVHEVDDSEPLFASGQSVEEFISAKGLHKLQHVRQMAEAIRLDIPRSSRATLTWGLGSVPETFVDMTSVRLQLQLLASAQRSGQISPITQNERITDYLRQAA